MVAQVVGRVQEAWAEGKLADMRLMEVKGAFDHVSRTSLLQTLEGIGADGRLVRRTESFMSERRIGLVIDGHQCEKPVVDSGVPQGSPVSHILFTMYQSGVFKEVEKKI